MSGFGLLRGRRALITGAAQGIGAATARRFAQEGARVALTDLDGDGAAKQARALEDEGLDVFARGLDVTDDSAVGRALAGASGAFGGLDLVVANAGVSGLGTLDETSVEAMERTLRVNVCGVYSVFRHALPHLRNAGGGEMLATSSLAGKAGVANLSAYSASKFAVVGLVESLAKELGPEGIRVCAVAPGFVDTPMLMGELASFRAAANDKSEDEVRAAFVKSIPLGRLISPEEVANTFVYLASSLASGVTGELVKVSGGGS